MKILFVNFIKFWGGGESWTFQVMDELRKRNHSVVLLSNTKSELAVKAKANGFETHSAQVNKLSFLNLFHLSAIKKKLIEIKPDIIILNSTLELKTIGFQIKASGCNKVFFLRGIPKPVKINLLKRYLFSNVVSGVIVNSNYVKNSIANIAKLLRNPPEVIYHGIDAETPNRAASGTKNIAIVGRLSHEKGVDIALTVFQKVLKAQPEAKLWIIGDGAERQNLINITEKLGIQNSVNFVGFVSNVEEELMKCSILIMTSRWEGFGLVLLEAMKLRMPCLAFDHIAANEIIVDKVTGFLIPDMNTDIMSEKIIHLLSNPQTALEMGENGNHLLKEKFAIEKIIDQYEKLMI